MVLQSALSSTPDRRDRGGPAQPLLIARDLRKHFPVKGSRGKSVQAVDGVSFTVAKGETLGIVGESGCGKSTLARLLLHLLVPDAGELVFDGDAVGAQDGIAVDALRRQVQMVFQDSVLVAEPAHADPRTRWRSARLSRARKSRRRGALRATSLAEWASIRTCLARAIRTSFPAGKSSGSILPARWRPGRAW